MVNKELQIALDSQEAFAIYSTPSQNDYFLIKQRDNKTHLFDENAFDSAGFVFHPFCPDEKSPPIILKADIVYKNPTISFKYNILTSFSTSGKDDYIKNATAFISATHSDFRKLVLSRLKIVKNKHSDLIALFLKMKDRYPDAFVYLFNHPKTGCWMGASPEIFLTESNGKYRSIALAGTTLYFEDFGEHSWSEKDKKEQAVVMRYIEDLLGKHKTSFFKNGPVTVKAGKLLHIKTSYSFEKPNNLYAFSMDLHPSPAVCGIPKLAAMDFILRNESHDRKYYSGFLGPINKAGSMSLFVNLRCMQVTNEQFILYLGGGILKDSVAELEWEETENKAKTLMDLIKLQN